MRSTSVSMNRSTRASLILRARTGNRDSLAKLMIPYAPGIYFRGLRLTGNSADAEDVRQETLLKAMSHWEQFDGTQAEGRDDLYAWVSRIAVNASIDMIRKRRDGKLFSLDQPSGDTDETPAGRLAARGDNPEEHTARLEVRKLMSDAIMLLAPELRQVCLLRDVFQYSTHEVAVRLRISPLAVRLRLFRAHRRLHEKLSPVFQPSKKQPSHAMAKQLSRRVEPRTCERRAPLVSFAECACGD